MKLTGKAKKEYERIYNRLLLCRMEESGNICIFCVDDDPVDLLYDESIKIYGPHHWKYVSLFRLYYQVCQDCYNIQLVMPDPTRLYILKITAMQIMKLGVQGHGQFKF